MARTNDVWETGAGGTYIQTIAPLGYDLLINGSNHYVNFNSVVGSSGYGFRDNSGTMEFKNSGGSWTAVGAGAGGTVTSVASADGSITVTNPTTTVDLAVVSAPKLTTARTINGTSFDGTANITVTAAAGTLTGTTLNSTVVTSSLTSVGTLTNLTVTNAPTFSAMTLGSVLFAGTSGVLSQDNANFFWDSTNHRLGIGTTSPGAMLQVNSSATGTKGIISKNIASQTANNFEAQNSSGTAYVTIGSDTLSGSSSTSNFLNVTGTLPSSTSASTYGVNVNVTSAGSSANQQNALWVQLNAGYTGSGGSIAGAYTNSVAGTGTIVFGGNLTANAGTGGNSNATTAGTNVGLWSNAQGGNVNYGLFAGAQTAKNSATNIGVAGIALNTGSSPIQIGGYFGLQNTMPTFVSAALIADNGSTSSPVFLGRVNGNAIIQIDSAGSLIAGLAGTSTGILKFNGTTSGTVTLSTADAAGTWTMKLPTTAGTNGYVLQTDGSGNTSWVAQSGGSGLTVGTSTITSGTNTRILYDNSGVLGEYTISGSGTVVAMATSPSFTTPTLGVATATTINKVTLTAPATGSTLTIADGKTLTVSNTLTLAGTDSQTMTFPALSGTVVVASELQYDYVIYKSGSNIIAITTSTGATLSSSTTASTTIQAVLNALTSGGNVLIKDATYTITVALKIKGANTRIFGQGSNTILQADGNAVSPLITFNSTSYNNCQLEKMVLNNTNGTHGTAILHNDAAWCVYRDLQLNGWLVGIQMTDSINTTFYNRFYDCEIFTTTTCIDIAPSGNPVNDNSFYNMRNSPNANGYGVRIRGGSNGNNFYSFDSEPASLSGQKGVSIEASSYGMFFSGLYVEGNATGISIASGCQANTFVGGIIDGNTADISDSGNQNFFMNIERTSDIFTQMVLPFTIVDQTGNSSTLTIVNNTNFAHVSSNLATLQLLNGTDSSTVLNLLNAGTGAYLTADGKFTLGNSGYATKINSISTAGLGNPAIYSESITVTKTANFTVLAYTPPAVAGRYRVTGVITTTSSTNTGTVQFTLDYKDSQGTTHTADIIPLVDATGAIATTKSGASKEYHTIPWEFTINNAATVINLKVVITGSVSYTAAGMIEQIA